MRTANGKTFPITAMCGFRMSPKTGLRIATVTGFMSRTTAGRGLATSLGAGPHITTVAGSPMALVGHGGRDRYGLATTRSGRRHTYRSGDGAAVLDSASDLAGGAASAGSRSDRATGSIPGGVDTAAGLVGWVEVGGVAEAVMAGTVVSPRCITDSVTPTLPTSATDTWAEECRQSMLVASGRAE